MSIVYEPLNVFAELPTRSPIAALAAEGAFLVATTADGRQFRISERGVVQTWTARWKVIKLFVREWISGAREPVRSWSEAYALRDQRQAASLAAGYDLLKRRYGVEVEWGYF